ncbi:lysozyme inhibitor LprI family protein [Sphingomonas sp. A2-49]|uniref:lysozyme inhibitor LprI family protein n=1 Tax=Sphingomonas sp. A2-49 TaxID=1391375 RepID=UPI0021D02DFE|nr:lysozyme inhibitor LprI family protein [Sphingomonas sp. A2-49]MCU6454083.1 lysozyme inhibitor LprI family protein [Sphingomonas sp. A2-49]
MLAFALALAISGPLDRCLDTGEAARGVTSAMSACFVADYRRADDRLNATYRTTMNRLPAPRRAALRQSQRAWIGTRDAACPLQQGDGVGTIEMSNHPACLAKRTRQRIVWLTHFR